MCSKQHIKIKDFQCQERGCILEENTGGILRRKRWKHAWGCGACQCHSSHTPALRGSHIFRQSDTGGSCPWHTHRGMAAALFTLSCSKAVCSPLFSRSWRNTSENTPYPSLFQGWILNSSWRWEGFGHLATLHSRTPMRDLPSSSPEQKGCCHNQTLTCWSHFDPVTTLEKPLQQVMLE